MDFGLSPNQVEVRAAVRGMARRDLAPGYLDRARSTAFPWDAHRRVAQLGVLGLLAGWSTTRSTARITWRPGSRWRSWHTPTLTWRTR